jgi:hypothetical protein
MEFLCGESEYAAEMWMGVLGRIGIALDLDLLERFNRASKLAGTMSMERARKQS